MQVELEQNDKGQWILRVKEPSGERLFILPGLSADHGPAEYVSRVEAVAAAKLHLPFHAITVPAKIKERLEYLRGELRAERISWGEIAELQDLAPHIEDGDVELLEPAGVPEFPESV